MKHLFFCFLLCFANLFPVFSQEYKIVVDSKGNGDFRQIQDALESIRAFDPKGETTVYIKDGVYREKLVLYFPAGEYLTGAIYMKSNITLQIESGAIIRFSNDFEDYLPFMKVRWEGVVMHTFAPLINAQNAENITITGRGIIDGQGQKWWDYHRKVAEAIRSGNEFAQKTDCQNL
jgi:pectin methylesterase-like acyl-CoA thioesterase